MNHQAYHKQNFSRRIHVRIQESDNVPLRHLTDELRKLGETFAQVTA